MQQGEEEENIDLQQSQGMNQNQQALFLNIQRSKSVDSVFGKLLPQAGDGHQRSLVWEISPQFTNNILVPQTRSLSKQQQPQHRPLIPPAIRIFKKLKKQKVRSKCDYDKNICGYITKKVIRQFVSRNYEVEVRELVEKYNCNYEECKGYYLRRVEMVTGPSHLPELFDSQPNQPEGVVGAKRVFRSFYRWFLRERYLRYLLLEGKMSNKQAYIEYKNSHLFRFVREESQEQIPLKMRTRSKSNVKLQD